MRARQRRLKGALHVSRGVDGRFVRPGSQEQLVGHLGNE
jgi:hypothetical protein